LIGILEVIRKSSAGWTQDSRLESLVKYLGSGSGSVG